MPLRYGASKGKRKNVSSDFVFGSELDPFFLVPLFHHGSLSILFTRFWSAYSGVRVDLYQTEKVEGLV